MEMHLSRRQSGRVGQEAPLHATRSFHRENSLGGTHVGPKTDRCAARRLKSARERFSQGQETAKSFLLHNAAIAAWPRPTRLVTYNTSPRLVRRPNSAQSGQVGCSWSRRFRCTAIHRPKSINYCS